jgi:hypothetical protein
MADNAAASAAANLCVKNKYVGVWSTLKKKTTSINFGKRKSKTKNIGIGIYWNGTINWEHWLGILI